MVQVVKKMLVVNKAIFMIFGRWCIHLTGEGAVAHARPHVVVVLA
jgi:hypothetical protein